MMKNISKKPVKKVKSAKKVDLKPQKIATSIFAANVISAILPYSVIASDITGVTPDGNVYNIDAVKHSGATGFRQYTDFTLDKGDIANLKFKDGQQNFVNLVDNRVNINGILNTMQGNNFYNGHAIFVSPAGMIVGASGVLNVGSFSAITPSQSLYNIFKNSYNSNNLSAYEYSSDSEKYKSLITNSSGDVVVMGKILARDEVNIYGGKNVKVQGTSAQRAGIIAGWQDTNTVINSQTQAENLFNSLVNSNIKTASSFALTDGKIKLVSNVSSKLNDDAGDIKTEIDVKNADIGAGDVNISAKAEVDRQERIDLAESVVNVEKSNIKGSTVSITAEASQNKSLNLTNLEDTVTLIENTLVDIFDPDTPSITSLWGTAGKAKAEVTIKDSVINAVKMDNETENSLIINAIASSATSENSNLLTPSIIDFITNSDEAKISEYFSNDIYTGFEGARSSAEVTVENSVLQSMLGMDITSNASSSLKTDDAVLSFILPIGIYGVGTDTISNAIIRNSFLNSNFGRVTVDAVSTNSNSVSITNSSLVKVNIETSWLAIMLNNTVKTHTEALIENSIVKNPYGSLQVFATNLSNSDSDINMNAIAGTASEGSNDAGNSAAAVVGILNRSDNDISAVIKDSTVDTAGNTLVMADSINITGNTVTAGMIDKTTEKPKALGDDIKSKISKLSNKLNFNIIDKIKGIKSVPATKQALFEGGGAFIWNVTDNNSTAKIENSTVNAGSVNVQAATVDLMKNNASAESAGEAKIGLGLAVIYNDETNTTKANVDGSKINANSLTVDAMTEMPMNMGSLTFGLKLPFKIKGVDTIQFGGNFASEANGKWDVSVADIVNTNYDAPNVDLTGTVKQELVSSFQNLKPKYRMSGFFNNLAKTETKASTAGIAGSVVYNEVKNTTTADITNHSKIILANEGALTVNAVNSIIGYNAAGMIDFLIRQLNYTVPGQQDWVYQPEVEAGTFGLGFNFLWDDYTNNATAKIENSSVLVPNGSINVNSATEQSYITIVMTGGKVESVGIDGSIHNQLLRGTTLASISNTSDEEKENNIISAKDVNVIAGKAKVRTAGGSAARITPEVIKKDKEESAEKGENPKLTGLDYWLSRKEERDAEETITNIIAQGAWTTQSSEGGSSTGVAVGASVNVTDVDRTVTAEINNAVVAAENVTTDSDSFNQTLNIEIAAAFSGGVDEEKDAADADKKVDKKTKKDDKKILKDLNEEDEEENSDGNPLPKPDDDDDDESLYPDKPQGMKNSKYRELLDAGYNDEEIYMYQGMIDGGLTDDEAQEIFNTQNNMYPDKPNNMSNSKYRELRQAGYNDEEIYTYQGMVDGGLSDSEALDEFNTNNNLYPNKPGDMSNEKYRELRKEGLSDEAINIYQGLRDSGLSDDDALGYFNNPSQQGGQSGNNPGGVSDYIYHNLKDMGFTDDEIENAFTNDGKDGKLGGLSDEKYWELRRLNYSDEEIIFYQGLRDSGLSEEDALSYFNTQNDLYPNKPGGMSNAKYRQLRQEGFTDEAIYFYQGMLDSGLSEDKINEHFANSGMDGYNPYSGLPIGMSVEKYEMLHNGGVSDDDIAAFQGFVNRGLSEETVREGMEILFKDGTVINENGKLKISQLEYYKLREMGFSDEDMNNLEAMLNRGATKQGFEKTMIAMYYDPSQGTGLPSENIEHLSKEPNPNNPGGISDWLYQIYKNRNWTDEMILSQFVPNEAPAQVNKNSNIPKGMTEEKYNQLKADYGFSDEEIAMFQELKNSNFTDNEIINNLKGQQNANPVNILEGLSNEPNPNNPGGLSDHMYQMFKSQGFSDEQIMIQLEGALQVYQENENKVPQGMSNEKYQSLHNQGYTDIEIAAYQELLDMGYTDEKIVSQFGTSTKPANMTDAKYQSLKQQGYSEKEISAYQELIEMGYSDEKIVSQFGTGVKPIGMEDDTYQELRSQGYSEKEISAYQTMINSGKSAADVVEALGKGGKPEGMTEVKYQTLRNEGYSEKEIAAYQELLDMGYTDEKIVDKFGTGVKPVGMEEDTYQDLRTEGYSEKEIAAYQALLDAGVSAEDIADKMDIVVKPEGMSDSKYQTLTQQGYSAKEITAYQALLDAGVSEEVISEKLNSVVKPNGMSEEQYQTLSQNGYSTTEIAAYQVLRDFGLTDEEVSSKLNSNVKPAGMSDLKYQSLSLSGYSAKEIAAYQILSIAGFSDEEIVTKLNNVVKPEGMSVEMYQTLSQGGYSVKEIAAYQALVDAGVSDEQIMTKLNTVVKPDGMSDAKYQTLTQQGYSAKEMAAYQALVDAGLTDEQVISKLNTVVKPEGMTEVQYQTMRAEGYSESEISAFQALIDAGLTDEQILSKFNTGVKPDGMTEVKYQTLRQQGYSEKEIAAYQELINLGLSDNQVVSQLGTVVKPVGMSEAKYQTLRQQGYSEKEIAAYQELIKMGLSDEQIINKYSVAGKPENMSDEKYVSLVKGGYSVKEIVAYQYLFENGLSDEQIVSKFIGQDGVKSVPGDLSYSNYLYLHNQGVSDAAIERAFSENVNINEYYSGDDIAEMKMQNQQQSLNSFAQNNTNAVNNNSNNLNALKFAKGAGFGSGAAGLMMLKSDSGSGGDNSNPLPDLDSEFMENPAGDALNSTGSAFSLSAAGAVNVTTDEIKVDSAVKNSTITVKNKVTVDSDREARMLNVSAGVAGSKKIGAGAAVNVYEQAGSVKSHVNDSEITYTGETPKLDITADNLNQFIEIAIGVGAAVNDEQAGAGFKAAAGGSASANIINPEVDTYIKGATIGSQNGKIDAELNAKNEITIYNVAGGGSYNSGSSAGVSAGAAVNYNNIGGAIYSYIKDSTLNDLNKLGINAEAENDIMEFAVAGAIMTGTEGSGLGIEFAGSANIDYIHDTISAQIIKSVVTAENDVVVTAESNSENLQVAGSFDYTSAKTGAGVNGSIAVNQYENNILALIDEDSQIKKANNVTVSARSEELANVIPIGLSLSTDKNLIMLSATVGVNIIDNSVRAYIRGNIGTDENNVNNVNVTAYDETTLYTRGGTLAAAAADTTANIGGSFNRDLISKTVEAKIGHDDYTYKDSDGNEHKVHFDDRNSVKASGDVSVSAASINSLGGTKNSSGSYDRNNINSDTYSSGLMTKDEDGYYSDIDYDNGFENWNMFYNFAVGAKASISGAVIVKTIEDDVKAEITNADITADNLNLMSTDYSVKNIIAGQISASSKGAVGAQVLVTSDSSTTSSLISNNSNIKLANTLNITSWNRKDNKQIVIAANAAGKVAGGVNVVHNSTDDTNTAKIENSTVSANTININADEDINAERIVAAVSASSKVALNVSPVINYYEGETTSQISGSSVNNAEINLNSLTDIKTMDIDVGVGGAGTGFAAQGLVIKNTYDTTTKSVIDSGSVINTIKNVVLNADSVTDSSNWIVGASGLGTGFNVVANVIINDVISDTEASISNSVIQNAGNIQLNTNKDKKDKYKNFGIGAGFAVKGGSAVVTTIYNLFNNSVTSKIYNTSIANSNSIETDAYSSRDIDNVDISASAAGIGFAGAASALVNEINSTTLSYVDAQSKAIKTSGKLTVKAEDTTTADNRIGFGTAAGLGAAAGASVNLYTSDNLVKAEVLSNSNGSIEAQSADINSKIINGLDNTTVGVAVGLAGIAADVQVIKIGKESAYSSSEQSSKINDAIKEVKKSYDSASSDGHYNPEAATSKTETGSVSRIKGNLKTANNTDVKAQSKLKGTGNEDKLTLTNVSVTAGGTAANVAVRDVQLASNTKAEIAGGTVKSTSGSININSESKSNVEMENTEVTVSGVKYSGGVEIYDNTSNTIASIGSDDRQTKIEAKDVNVTANSVSNSNLEAHHVVVTSQDMFGVNIVENTDTNNGIARVTGLTDINADGKLNVHSTVDTDLHSSNNTVSVTGVSLVSVLKNETQANTVVKAVIENMAGTINAKSIDLITDYNKMSSLVEYDITSVSAASVASYTSSKAVMNADFTSGIYKLVKSGNSLIAQTADTIINNSGELNIATAKKLGNEQIKAESVLENTRVSLIDFYSGSFGEAQNTANSNTYLKVKENNSGSLLVNSYLDSLAKVNTTSKGGGLISVKAVGADASDTSNLNVDFSGRNNIAGCATVNANHNASVSSELETLNVGLVAGNRIRIDSTMDASTTGNIAGDYTANNSNMKFNTTRYSYLSKAQKAGGAISVSDTKTENTLTGSSVLNVGIVNTTNTANNKMTIKNTSANTLDTVSKMSSGGVIDVSVSGDKSTLNTNTTTNIKNANINSKDTVAYEVENKTLVEDSGASSNGGFVAVLKNDYDRTYSSGAYLNLENTEINANNIDLNTYSDIRSKGDKTFYYDAGGGGFVAVSEVDVDNTLSQTSKIDLNNTKLYAQENTVLSAKTGSLFKQFSDNESRGFVGAPSADIDLNVTNSNIINLDSSSIISALNNAVFNFDSNNTLSSEAVSEAYGFEAPAEAYSDIRLTINNELNNKGKISAGNLADINYMGNSYNNLYNRARTESTALVADTEEGGSLIFTVNNKLIVQSGAKIVSNKDVEVNYSGGGRSLFSKIIWETNSGWGLVSDDDYWYSDHTYINPKLELNGQIIAGEGNSKYIVIDKDGSINQEKTSGFSEGEYSLTGGESVNGEIVKAKKLSKLDSKIQDANKELENVTNRKESIDLVIEGYEEEKTSYTNIQSDFDSLVEGEYTILNVVSTTQGEASEFETKLQNDLKLQIVGEGEDKINAEKYESFLSAYNTEIQSITENNNNPENTVKEYPTLMEFLDDNTSLELSDAQKTTIKTAYETAQSNKGKTQNGAFRTYVAFDGTKYAGAKNPTTVDNVKSCDEISTLSTKIEEIDAKIADAAVNQNAYNTAITNLNNEIISLTNEKTAVSNTASSEFAILKDEDYSIVFNDINLVNSHIKLDGITNNRDEMQGSGEFRVASSGVKIDNYSTRSLVFNDIDLGSSYKNGLIIGDKNFSEFANNEKAINGENAHYYKFGKNIIFGIIEYGSFDIVGKSGAHYTTGGASGTSGIIVNNFYDTFNPFAKNQSIMLPALASDIIFNGSISSSNGLKVFNDSGSIIAKAINTNTITGAINLIATKGDVNLTSGYDFNLSSTDNIFAGNSVNIKAKKVDINGTVNAGYNSDLKLTITDEMLSNLTIDPVTGEKNLINLGDTFYLNSDNNIKAIYKDGNIYVYNINEAVKGIDSANRGKIAITSNSDTNTFTGTINMYDGVQKIAIDNQTDKHLIVSNITNSKGDGGLYINNTKNTEKNTTSNSSYGIEIKSNALTDVIGSLISKDNGDVTITSEGLNLTNTSVLDNKKGNITITNNSDKNENSALTIEGTVKAQDGNITIANNGKTADLKGIVSGEKGDISITNNKGDMTILSAISHNKTNQTSNGMISITNAQNSGKLDIKSAIQSYGAGKTVTEGESETLAAILINNQSTTGGLELNDGTISARLGDIVIKNSAKDLNLVSGTISNTDGDVTIINTGDKLTSAASINAKQGDINISNTGKGEATVGGNITNQKGNTSITNTNTEGGNIKITGNIEGKDGNIAISNNGTGFEIASDSSITNNNGDINITNSKGKLSTKGKIENKKGNITVTNAGINADIAGEITSQEGNIAVTNSEGQLIVKGEIENEKGNISVINSGTNADVSGEITANNGNITVTNNSGAINVKGTIANVKGDTTITNNSGNLTISENANIKNTQNGNITVDNKGGKLSIAGLIEHSGIGSITAKNNGTDGLEITNTGKIAANNGNLTVENTAGALLMAGELSGAKGNVSVTNSGVNADITGKINADEADILVTNNAGTLNVTGEVSNAKGNTTLINNDGDLKINEGAKIQNTALGNIKAENKGGKLSIAGLIQHLGKGNIDVKNTGDSGLETAATSKISANNGNISVDNAKSVLSLNGAIENTKGNTTITNTGSTSDINGTILAKDGNINIINTNAGALNIKGSIKNENGNTNITNNSIDGLNAVANSIIEQVTGNTTVTNNSGDLTIEDGAKIILSSSGDISVVNSGKEVTIAGLIEHQGNDAGAININNSGTGKLNIVETALIHAIDGNIKIANTSLAGIDLTGLIKADKQNIEISTKNSDLRIGSYLDNNENYINAITDDVIITADNGSILNGIVDAVTDRKHQNYDLGNPNSAYKTLISAGNDLNIEVKDGNIGCTSNEKPGFTIGASTRDYTDSINVNVEGNVTAKALNDTKTDARLVNIRAKDSDLNVKDVTSDGNVILTAADWKQADTRPTPDDEEYFEGYSIYNTAYKDDAAITGQFISVIASDKLGEEDKKLVYMQDTLNAPVSSVSFETENDLNVTGKANSETETKLYQIISKNGNINLDFESNAAIKEITSGKGLRVIQKAQNLTVYDLGMPVSAEGASSPFEDMLNPHDNLVYGIDEVSPENSVIPNYIDIRAYDAIENPDRSDSNIKIYNATVAGNHGENTQYYENGTRLADVTLMADNIYVNSAKAPNSIISTSANPNGYKHTGTTYTDSEFGGDGTVVYQAKGINAWGNGDPISLDVVGVDEILINQTMSNSNRNKYNTQKSVSTTPHKFVNPDDEIVYYGTDYKAKNTVISVNDYSDTNRGGVVFDTLYADNAYINTPEENLSFTNSYITNFGEFRNSNKTAVVDNDYIRLIKEADIQLYTKKTGSFNLALNRTINMITNAPTLFNNQHELVRGYHSAWNFINRGYKENKIMADYMNYDTSLLTDAANVIDFNFDVIAANNELSIIADANEEYDVIAAAAKLDGEYENNGEVKVGNKTSDLTFVVFDTMGELDGLSSDVKIYSISTTGAITSNEKNWKKGEKVSLNLNIDGLDIIIDAKVKSIDGKTAKLEFKNMSRSLANKLLYKYMQANSEKMNLTAL